MNDASSSTTAYRLGPFDRSAQGDELAALLGVCFNFPPEDAPDWWDRAGDDQLRVLHADDDRIAGTILYIPMGHFLGGRSVKCCGVAGVAVAHEFRGRGAATWMMRESLREMRELGYPMTSLYPSTMPLYRKAGYEMAGIYYTTTLPLRSIQVHGHERVVRPVLDTDIPAIEELYRRVAAEHQGWLDRGWYLWSRARKPRAGTAHGFVAEGPDGVEGYLWFVNQKGEGWKSRMMITDLAAATPEAGRSLLGFLSGNATMHEDATCHLAPDEPLMQLIPDHSFRSRMEERWMLRLLDPAAAMRQRGWAEGLAGAVELELRDDLFPENEGRWMLEVADGEASLEPGGGGRLKLDVRQLAQLYTGFQTPAALARTGLLEGPAEDLATAAMLFAGPQPQLPEMF